MIKKLRVKLKETNSRAKIYLAHDLNLIVYRLDLFFKFDLNISQFLT